MQKNFMFLFDFNKILEVTLILNDSVSFENVVELRTISVVMVSLLCSYFFKELILLDEFKCNSIGQQTRLFPL